MINVTQNTCPVYCPAGQHDNVMTYFWCNLTFINILTICNSNELSSSHETKPICQLSSSQKKYQSAYCYTSRRHYQSLNPFTRHYQLSTRNLLQEHYQPVSLPFSHKTEPVSLSFPPSHYQLRPAVLVLTWCCGPAVCRSVMCRPHGPVLASQSAQLLGDTPDLRLSRSSVHQHTCTTRDHINSI